MEWYIKDNIRMMWNGIIIGCCYIGCLKSGLKDRLKGIVMELLIYGYVLGWCVKDR